METRTPSLKLLRSLLAEADRIPFPIKEAGRLRKFVNVANEWVEAATKVLVRKHHQGRRVVDRAQGSNGKRLEDLQEMLRQVERLRFDCPEIRQLEESIEIMLDFQMDARRALKRPEHDVAECRELYEYGLSMNIVMDEIDQLEVIVTDLTWAERVSSKGVLQEDFLLICNFVDDAEKNGVSSSNPLLMEMIKKREAGLLWEEKAQEVLNKNPIDLDELRAVIEDGRSFPVPRNVLSKAEQLHSKALELKKTADQLAKRSREPKYGNRPSVLDLKRLLKTADSMPIDIEHKEMLEQESKKFDDWLTACQQLLLSPTSKKQAGMELEGALDDLKQNVEACTAEEKTPLPVVSSNGVHRVNTVSAPGNKLTETVNEDNGSSLDSNTITKRASNDQAPATADSGPESLSSGAEDKAVDVAEMTMPPVADTPMEESLKMDISDDVERDEQIYCLCRSTESGMMVECDECHEWYHGPCVRVTKREATTKSNYICPVCNLSLVIKRDKPRPTLEELVKMSELAQSLLFFTPEVPLLESIVHTVMEFQKKVDQFLKRDIITEKDVLQVKAFLRKIEGLDIELAGEREVLRTHVLRLCPSSMPVPGVVLSTYPSAPPLATIVSTCLCTQRSAATPQTELVSPQMELTPSPLEQPTPPLGPPISPLEPQDMGEVMIQCGICSDWLHIHCAGLDVEQVQKLSKFVCPVCCLVKKKPYTYGQAANPAEGECCVYLVTTSLIAPPPPYTTIYLCSRRNTLCAILAQARASERMQANKDTTKQRRQKLSKDSIDLTGLVTGTEEKKKRPYKKREHSETGDKPKKRRKSSGGQSTMSTGSTDSNVTTPHATTLPSFSEGFLLHDRTPIKSPVESHHLNRPSHVLPYSPPLGHPIHTQPHYHGPSNPPSQQQRYGSHPNGVSYHHYARERVQLPPLQTHAPPPHPLSHSPPQLSPISHSHSHTHHSHTHHSHTHHSHTHHSHQHHVHAHPHSRSHRPPPISLHHPHSPTSHDRADTHLYRVQQLSPVQHGHYSLPGPHQHQHSHSHQHHSHNHNHSQRGLNDYHPDQHARLNDLHNRHSHYSNNHSPPASDSNARAYASYNSRSPTNTAPVLPPLKNHPSTGPSNGLKGSATGKGEMPSGDRFKRHQEAGSGGETETDDEDESPTVSTKATSAP